jgi:hypothetical protein
MIPAYSPDPFPGSLAAAWNSSLTAQALTAALRRGKAHSGAAADGSGGEIGTEQDRDMKDKDR